MKNIARTIASSIAITSFFLAGPAMADHHEEKRAAPAPVAETKAAVETLAPGKPALWKVADEDTTIYLFGTVHALPKHVEWMGPSISSALNGSDTIVTEVMMDDTMQAKMLSLIGQKAMLPADTTLRSLLNDDQKAEYEGALAKLGMPAASFDRFEPWYAAMVLTMMPLMQQGYTPDAGAEEVLLKASGEKPRAALETIEFQLGLFDELPQDSQVAFLSETAKNVEGIKSQLDAMVAEWLEGDADALAVLMNDGLTDATLANELLYKRNQNWANWIDDRLDQPGSVFIAVGAGHLAGEKSVQDLLGKMGITAQRVQ